MTTADTNDTATATGDEGFTLAELMVVIALFSLIAGIIVSLLLTAHQIGEVAVSRNQAQEEARRILGETATELRAARPLVGCVTDSNGRCQRLAETSDRSDSVFTVCGNTDPLSGTCVEPSGERDVNVSRQFNTDDRGGVLMYAGANAVAAPVWPSDASGNLLAPHLVEIALEPDGERLRLVTRRYPPEDGIDANNVANTYRGNLQAGNERALSSVWDMTSPVERLVGHVEPGTPVFRYVLDDGTILTPAAGSTLTPDEYSRVVAVTVSPTFSFLTTDRGGVTYTNVSVTAALRGERFLREQFYTGADQ